MNTPLAIRPKDCSPLQALQHAVDLLGSDAALAKAVGSSHQVVCNWLRRGRVSAQGVLGVAAATKWLVRPHDLRPDIYPSLTDGIPPDAVSAPADTGTVSIGRYRDLQLRYLDTRAELDLARQRLLILEQNESTHAAVTSGIEKRVTQLYAAAGDFLADLEQRATQNADYHPSADVRDFFKDDDEVVLPVGNGVLFRLRCALGHIDGNGNLVKAENPNEKA